MKTQKENGNKARFRKPKEIHIEIIPDENHVKAVKLIKLFGIPAPPVFTNVIKTVSDTEEEED